MKLKNYPLENLPGKFMHLKEKTMFSMYSFLKKTKILGFDTESKPTFKKGVSSMPP